MKLLQIIAVSLVALSYTSCKSWVAPETEGRYWYYYNSKYGNKRGEHPNSNITGDRSWRQSIEGS